MRRSLLILATLALVAAACATQGEDTTTIPGDGATAPGGGETTTSMAEGPAMGPSALTAEAQTSDGTSIVIASVTLPSPGFLAIHGDAGGSPGAVLGSSELLPAGESTDVTVTLDQPLTESGTLYPMVHIDVNGNGEYEFFPPDQTIDGPGTTDSGDVAMVPVEVTVG